MESAFVRCNVKRLWPRVFLKGALALERKFSHNTCRLKCINKRLGARKYERYPLLEISVVLNNNVYWNRENFYTSLKTSFYMANLTVWS